MYQRSVSLLFGAEYIYGQSERKNNYVWNAPRSRAASSTLLTSTRRSNAIDVIVESECLGTYVTDPGMGPPSVCRSVSAVLGNPTREGKHSPMDRSARIVLFVIAALLAVIAVELGMGRPQPVFADSSRFDHVQVVATSFVFGR